MITTMVLVNTSILPLNYHYFFMVRTFKMCSLSNFQVYSNTVLLAIITMLHIRSAEFINLKTGSLYPLSNISSFPPPQASQPSLYSSVPWSLAFIDSTYKWYSAVFVCLSVSDWLSTMPSSFTQVVMNIRIPFSWLNNNV